MLWRCFYSEIEPLVLLMLIDPPAALKFVLPFPPTMKEFRIIISRLPVVVENMAVATTALPMHLVAYRIYF